MSQPEESDSSESEEKKTKEEQFKVVLLGNGTVGKTSLFQKLRHDFFPAEYHQTLGVEFESKKIRLYGDDESTLDVRLQIWDIGGQTLGSTMLDRYLSGADGALLVYDITNLDSFLDLSSWLDRCHPGTLTALVGNKYDLIHLRQVDFATHKQFCETRRLLSYYCSAKTGDGLQQLFHHFAAQICGTCMSKLDLDRYSAVIAAHVQPCDRPLKGTHSSSSNKTMNKTHSQTSNDNMKCNNNDNNTHHQSQQKQKCVLL